VAGPGTGPLSSGPALRGDVHYHRRWGRSKCERRHWPPAHAGHKICAGSRDCVTRTDESLQALARHKAADEVCDARGGVTVRKDPAAAPGHPRGSAHAACRLLAMVVCVCTSVVISSSDRAPIARPALHIRHRVREAAEFTVMIALPSRAASSATVEYWRQQQVAAASKSMIS